MIFIFLLQEEGLYDEVWQAATILLPIKSVGVMGDERTYEYTIVLELNKFRWNDCRLVKVTQ